jgi:hypothetical protein
MGTFSIGGTAENRGLSRVDARLVDVLQRAAASSPYNVQLFSGIRPGDPRYHGGGNAVDIVLSDPMTGQEIPNLKSSVGFPIYEQFAKTARTVQQEAYPELTDNFRWGGYFGGGKGKYGAVDLMHFDLGPTAKMAGGSWETGLTPEQAKIVADMGAGKIYSGQGQRSAEAGEYANLWGRDSLQVPQDAQSAIASLLAPGGGTGVPDMPTAAQGYAPNLPGGMPPVPDIMPPVQVASAPPPLPSPPPSWANAGGFPIDEALTGASAQDVLAGGPRMDPRRFGPATGPIGPDMGSMLSPADVLAAGPRLRPGGAPDASLVPDPLSRLASGVTPPPPLSPAMPNPPMRPGGAPDAGLVPTPPLRASGLPDPRMRPDINDPSLSFNAPPYAGGGPTAGPVPSPMQSMVAGRPEFSGALPAAPRQSLSPRTPEITPDFINSLGLAEDMSRTRGDTGFWTGDLRPQASPPPAPFGRAPQVGNLNYSDMPSGRSPQTQAAVMGPGNGLGPYGMMSSPSPFASMIAGRPEFPGGGMPAAQGPFFDNANPGPTFTPSPPSGTSFNIPKSPFEGSTGEFFTPGPPMPSAPPAMSQGMRDQFNVAFSPGGGSGQIMDLQSAFNRQNAPSTMTAQDGINSIFGAPPAAAQPPNLAIPFTEVPGFDFSGRFNGAMPPTAAPPAPSSLFGPSPAAAATAASPLPSPMMPPSMTQADFDARFGGGSVVAPPVPTPGVTPGVVSGTMPQPMDIRPPAQGGPEVTAQSLSPPAPEPRQTNTAAEQQKQGLALRILGSVLGGPLGAIGSGILGGGGAAFTPFSGGPMINTGMGSFRSSGMAPNASGGMSAFQHGTAFNGSSPATTFKTNDGRTYTYSSDPITGAPIGGFV